MIRELTRRFLNDSVDGRRRFKPHAYGGGPFGVMAAAFRCGLNLLRPLASKHLDQAATRRWPATWIRSPKSARYVTTKAKGCGRCLFPIIGVIAGAAGAPIAASLLAMLVP